MLWRYFSFLLTHFSAYVRSALLLKVCHWVNRCKWNRINSAITCTEWRKQNMNTWLLSVEKVMRPTMMKSVSFQLYMHCGKKTFCVGQGNFSIFLFRIWKKIEAEKKSFNSWSITVPDMQSVAREGFCILDICEFFSSWFYHKSDVGTNSQDKVARHFMAIFMWSTKCRFRLR